MRKQRRKHRDDLGSVFATSVIVVMGGGVCAMVFAAGAPNAPEWLHPAILGGAGLLLVAFLAVRIPRGSTGLEFWNSLHQDRREHDKPIDYTPEPIQRKQGGRIGQQKPITAEEVREIRLNSSNTWVPSKERLRRTQERDDDVLE